MDKLRIVGKKEYNELLRGQLMHHNSVRRRSVCVKCNRSEIKMHEKMHNEKKKLSTTSHRQNDVAKQWYGQIRKMLVCISNLLIKIQRPIQ